MATLYDADGNEVVAMTPEEHEAKLQEELSVKLAEKEEHMKQKLDEFQKGKTSQELKEIERENAIAEAKAKAQEAIDGANALKEGHATTVKNFYAEQFAGTDPELRKKLDEAFKIVEAGSKANGIEIKEDKDYATLMTQAALMAGISGAQTIQSSPKFPMGGGYTPSFQPSENEVSDSDHETFLKETGYNTAKAE